MDHEFEIVAVGEQDERACAFVRAERAEDVRDRSVDARGRAGGVESRGGIHRRRGVAEFEKPHVIIGWIAVRRGDLSIRENAPRGVRASALLHVASRHAPRLIDGDERDAIRDRRRDDFEPRWLEQKQKHERDAEQAEDEQRDVLRAAECRADAEVNRDREGRKNQTEDERSSGFGGRIFSHGKTRKGHGRKKRREVARGRSAHRHEILSVPSVLFRG